MFLDSRLKLVVKLMIFCCDSDCIMWIWSHIEETLGFWVWLPQIFSIQQQQHYGVSTLLAQFFIALGAHLEGWWRNKLQYLKCSLMFNLSFFFFLLLCCKHIATTMVFHPDFRECLLRSIRPISELKNRAKDISWPIVPTWQAESKDWMDRPTFKSGLGVSKYPAVTGTISSCTSIIGYSSAGKRKMFQPKGKWGKKCTADSALFLRVDIINDVLWNCFF